MDVPGEPELPEADRQPGVPHPRETAALFGQAPAERAFLEAFNAGRPHHAWLLAGPMGIGKATLAWRIARFLLTVPMAAQDQGGGLFADVMPAEAPTTLDPVAGHPALRRVAALSEPRLHLLRRPWDEDKSRFKQDIPVDAVRRLKGFFNFSAVDGGRRVVIIDSADDLNSAAANALLKILEEPPADTTLLLVSHAPSRLLPTIRSRCRTLGLQPLGTSDLEAALVQAGIGESAERATLMALSDGSAGRAAGLAEAGGPEAYRSLVALLADLPRIDRAAMVKLAESAGARGAEDRFELLLVLVEFFLHRLARTGALGQPPEEAVAGEAALFTRLCPTPAQAQVWAQASAELVPRARAGRAVNLDPSSLLIDMFLGLQSAAA